MTAEWFTLLCLSTISLTLRVSHNVSHNLPIMDTGLRPELNHSIRQVSVSDCLAHDNHSLGMPPLHTKGLKSTYGLGPAMNLYCSRASRLVPI
ncbi:hypothetical protein M440DRAFT_1403632 [Trichoderma longibrachiatum ATCC 18648]|uniref:Uncharacterized protein n=1 Tax=Trichoderma longibrachiatum ATCC 18648 TaxID=983965 RepID=A0A2T4BY81_TRILO|nr:hypothetical protein M440DRAFT_1403632 [Trichoderma longibrachiatum ATCC 18648]